MYDMGGSIRNSLGVVYFLYSKYRSNTKNNEHLVKIGYTYNIRQRVKALSQEWNDLKIINLIYTPDPSGLEAKYHNIFHKYRTTRQSEWFNLPIDSISQIDEYNCLDLNLFERFRIDDSRRLLKVLEKYKSETYVCSNCGNDKNFLMYCCNCGKHKDKSNELHIKQKHKFYEYIQYQQRKWWFYENDSRYVEEFENCFSD